jgi:hypothetical protein
LVVLRVGIYGAEIARAFPFQFLVPISVESCSSCTESTTCCDWAFPCCSLSDLFFRALVDSIGSSAFKNSESDIATGLDLNAVFAFLLCSEDMFIFNPSTDDKGIFRDFLLLRTVAEVGPSF